MRSVKAQRSIVVDVVRTYENKRPQARSPPNSITMTEPPPPVPLIDQTTPPSPTQQKAGVLWSKVQDHVVSDDNFG